MCTTPGCIRPRMKNRSLCLACERERQRRKSKSRRVPVTVMETAHGFAVRLLAEVVKR